MVRRRAGGCHLPATGVRLPHQIERVSRGLGSSACPGYRSLTHRAHQGAQRS